MAELLGSVASGIGIAEVALAMGGSMFKLRELWKDMQDAPEMISHLKREVDMLQVLLMGLEDGFGIDGTESLSIHNFSVTKPAVSYCSRACDALSTLATDLGDQIRSATKSKRAMAKLKILLKQNEIEKFQERLDRAIDLLQLALTTLQLAHSAWQSRQIGVYGTQLNQLTALVKQQTTSCLVLESKKGDHASTSPDQGLQPSRVGADSTKCKKPPTTFSNTQKYGGLPAYRKGSPAAVYGLRIQLPKWFSEKVWYATATHFTYGWQMNISTINMVPRSAPIFHAIKFGDLARVRRLFERGLASPLDCDINGVPLAAAAFQLGHLHIVQELLQLEQTHQMSGALNIGQSILARMRSFIVEALCTDAWLPLLDQGLLNLMVDSIDTAKTRDMEMLLSCLSMLIAGTGLESTFRRAFSWDNIPPKDLAACILSEVDFRFGMEIEYLDTLLAPQIGRTPTELVRIWDRDGVSLVHICFFLSAGCIAAQEPARHAGQWHRYLREVMDASDDIHRKIPIFGYLGITDALSPLCVWLFQHSNDGAISPRIFQKDVRMLMTNLRDCGVDLLAYGEAEAAIIAEVDKARRLRGKGPLIKIMTATISTDRDLYLRELHYGPRPEDWKLEWGFIYDNEELCGEFWNMVENPPLHIHSPVLPVPGAWPEDWD